MVLAGLTGMFAAEGVMAPRQDVQVHEPAIGPRGFDVYSANPGTFEKIVEAQNAASEGMGDARTFVLGTLALVCLFTFVAAARMLRPGPLPRDRVRRLLVGACAGVALMRTVDGAQQAVILRSVALKAQQLIVNAPSGVDKAAFDRIRGTLPSFATALAGGWTAVVAGIFVVLAVYFSSEKIRALIRLVDDAGRSPG